MSSTTNSPSPRHLRGRRVGGRIEIRCVGCGYGGVVADPPTRCPMCGSTLWSEHSEKTVVPTERSRS